MASRRDREERRAQRRRSRRSVETETRRALERAGLPELAGEVGRAVDGAVQSVAREIERSTGRRSRRERPQRGLAHSFELLWGMVQFRRSESGEERLEALWGLVNLRLRRPDPAADAHARAAQRAEQRSEAVRAACILGSLGLGFAYLGFLSQPGLWKGLWSVNAVLMFACAGGLVLATFAERLRGRFLAEEVERIATVPGERERGDERGLLMQELAASIAHEIRNPITAAKSLVQQMGEDPQAGDNLEYARVALEELGRVERSVSHLLRFAREEELATQEVRLADLVREALALLRERADADGVELAVALGSESSLDGDPDKLRRVVLNLVGNAIDALAGAGTSGAKVEVGVGENLAGTEIWLRVRDNGPGIPESERDRVFRPFHTTKEQGTGLGLAITRKLVEVHGGSIELATSPTGGADFLVTLPRQRPS